MTIDLNKLSNLANSTPKAYNEAIDQSQYVEDAYEPTREELAKERMQLGIQMFDFEMQKREQAIKCMTAKDFPEACNKADASKAKKVAEQIKYVSSKELEAWTGKQHSNILRDIRNTLDAFEEYKLEMGEDSDLNPTDFIEVLDKEKSKNKKGMKFTSHYLLSPDGVEHVLSGYDPVRRMKLIKGLKRLAKLYAQKSAECLMTKRDAVVYRHQATDALKQAFFTVFGYPPEGHIYGRFTDSINMAVFGMTAKQREAAYDGKQGRDVLESYQRALIGLVEQRVAFWLEDGCFWIESTNKDGKMFDWNGMRQRIINYLPRIQEKARNELTPAQRIGLINLD